MSSNRQNPWKTFISCILAASMTACSATQSAYTRRNQPETSPTLKSWGGQSAETDMTNPVIAPGFLLTLHSIEDAKLNGDYRVDFDGNLQLPYDMTVNTAGNTVPQFEKRLNEIYQPYFKTSSGLQVHVKEQRYWIDVRGLVEKAGRYLVERNTSLDQVIAMAGGLNKDTPPWVVQIQKGPTVFIVDLDQYLDKGDRGQITRWLGGEILSFQREVAEEGKQALSTEHQAVYMMGEVRKPGEYPARTGYSLIDYLNEAEGFTQFADLGRIEVIRRNGRRTHIYDLTWEDVESAPVLQGGDVVFVHADVETKTERHLTIFATIVAAMASVATAAVLADRLH